MPVPSGGLSADSNRMLRLELEMHNVDQKMDKVVDSIISVEKMVTDLRISDAKRNEILENNEKRLDRLEEVQDKQTESQNKHASDVAANFDKLRLDIQRLSSGRGKNNPSVEYNTYNNSGDDILRKWGGDVGAGVKIAIGLLLILAILNLSEKLFGISFKDFFHNIL